MRSFRNPEVRGIWRRLFVRGDPGFAWRAEVIRAIGRRKALARNIYEIARLNDLVHFGNLKEHHHLSVFRISADP